VEVESVGTSRPLDPGVDLTAFRIVQEALTNVKKHAATEKARVQLTYSDDRITVTVTDEAAAQQSKTQAASASSGFGLIGMRERAQSVGGRLRAGRRPEGGFQVAAELPLHVQNPEPEEAP
jgi:signal transduction histidine kinase